MVFEIVQLVTKRTTTMTIDFELKISFKLKFQINMIKQYKILFAIHRYNELGYIYKYYLYSHIKNNAWPSVAKTGWLLTIDPPPRSSARLKLNKRCVFMWKGDGYVLSNNAVGLWDMGFCKSVKLISLNSETPIQLLFLEIPIHFPDVQFLFYSLLYVHSFELSRLAIIVWPCLPAASVSVIWKAIYL